VVTVTLWAAPNQPNTLILDFPKGKILEGTLVTGVANNPENPPPVPLVISDFNLE
jgi:hypothetical protein